MQSSLYFVGNTLPLLAAYFFFISLVPAGKIITELPSVESRHLWKILFGLVCVFVVGCLGYAVANWSMPKTIQSVLVPLVLVCGGVFVLLICLMSLKTAREVLTISELKYQAITDPLLGVFNRRYLTERLREECQRAERYNLDLSVLLIDIDHFKRVNDRHGHAAGDRVLLAIARTLMESIRETDVVARYGGEEFVVLAPSTKVDVATNLAGRLREAVEAHAVHGLMEPGAARSEELITVSIGVAGFAAGQDTPEAIIARADQAMYAAKRGGRNRICVASGAEGKNTQIENGLDEASTT